MIQLILVVVMPFLTRIGGIVFFFLKLDVALCLCAAYCLLIDLYGWFTGQLRTLGLSLVIALLAGLYQAVTSGPWLVYAAFAYCVQYAILYFIGCLIGCLIGLLKNWNKLRAGLHKKIGLRRWQFAGLVSVLVLAVAFGAYSQCRVTKLGKTIQAYDQQAAEMNRTIEFSETKLSEYINKYMAAKQELSNAKRTATLARMDISKLSLEHDFFARNIALINTDANYYYHTYDCSYFKGSSQYYAFNIEYARSLGYQPCQYCH